MSVTLKKIAELAGVSRGTVDRALNGRDGVKKEVAERIINIANELGYKPNMAAKALAGKRENKKIGIILNAESNPFYIDVIEGIKEKEKEIKDFGYELVLKIAKGYDINQQLKLIEEILAEKIMGLIISPINDLRVAQKLNELHMSNIPVVNINIDIEGTERIAYVGSNYEQAGKVAAGIFGLINNNGTIKVGIITGSHLVLGHNMRINGFKECIKNEFKSINIVDIKENNDNDIVSYNVTKNLIDEHPDIEGIFFCAGGIEGGIQAIAEKGLLKKINIITVDLTKTVRENLIEGNISATICQDPFKQGYESVKIMFEYLLLSKQPELKEFHTETQIKLKYNI